VSVVEIFESDGVERVLMEMGDGRQEERDVALLEGIALVLYEDYKFRSLLTKGELQTKTLEQLVVLMKAHSSFFEDMSREAMIEVLKNDEGLEEDNGGDFIDENWNDEGNRSSEIILQRSTRLGLHVREPN